MAGMTLNQFLHMAARAWRDEDGRLLADLLSLKDEHSASRHLQLEDPESVVNAMLHSPINEIVSTHFKCLYALSRRNVEDAMKIQQSLVTGLSKVLQSQKDDNWMLPLVMAACRDLRRIAIACDKSLDKRSLERKPGEMQDKAADALLAVFRICAADSRSSDDVTKRIGMLDLVNVLFKIYFSTSRLNLCKPLIRAIDSSSIRDQFSLAQMLTYKYYTGRKAMYDSEFDVADDCLSYAFDRCHRDCRRNKRQILIYLLPVKMLRGYMPNERLLEKYELMQFAELVEAVKHGDLLRLRNALKTNEAFFIRCGIYLILEKLKGVAFRNLFKKVCLITKSHQVPISSFVVALHMMEMPDVDEDEAECLIANLIFDNKIKGYISHQHRKLVISKQNAFPPLHTIR